MSSTAFGLMFGVLVGLRHAFEPDHLTAVSTLVSGTRGVRSSALLGALWGLGHTLALVGMGVILIGVGTTLPERASVVFELGVAAMLLVLGVRSIVSAVRLGAEHGHHHEGGHPPTDHVHVGDRTLAWRPLVVGLVHGLAGSGALTAIVFAELPGAGARVLYMVLFGAGSIGGMAVASGLAGATLQALARSGRTRRGMALVTGVLSIVVGVLWSIPLWSRLG